MPVSSTPARSTHVRHRAVGRPTTALSDLALAAAGTATRAGRRSAVVVAASGLIASAFAAPASAAPVSAAVASSTAVANSAAGHTVDTSALTAAARAVLETAPTVSVPADAAWTLDVPALSVVADPPPKAAPVKRAVAAATAASPAASSAVPASASGSAILEIASRYVGVPYLWGGGTPSGFDCSGFTSYVYAQLGITLPHSSQAQLSSGTVVSRADALPGDLMITPGHVALYAGGDMLIDATPGKTIRFHAIYQSNPVFIRVG